MPIHMKPSKWLYDFLKGYEKFRPTAYAATEHERKRGIWTIGYGHTKGVKEGDTCTMAEALEMLEDDVAESALNINKAVHVPLNQNQFDAIVSLTFNCGYGRKDGVMGDIADSTLLRKLNTGDYKGAQAEFTKWDKQAGKWLRGLDIRRDAEAAHFGAPV